MEYLLVSAFFFLLVFIPGIFCYLRAGLLVFTLLLFLMRKIERVNYLVLFSIILFSLFSKALKSGELSVPVKEANIRGVYGRVVTEPNRKKNRYIGYNIHVESIVNEKGDYFSSSGKLYVIGPDINTTFGDIVYVEGLMNGNYFLSSGGTVIRKTAFSYFRRKFNAAFIRSLPPGDAGNMTALLLTGTTLDGDGSLQEKVRTLGLSHLLSLSGMHLGFLSSIVMPLLLLMLPKRKAVFIKNVILFIFVYLAGFRPSLMRSLLFVFLIPLFGIAPSFVLSLVFLIYLFPFYVDEAAAILSFTSLSGILLFSDEQKFLEEKNIPLLSSFGVISITGVAASLMSAPVAYKIFGAWQPLAFLFSIFGMPLITALFILTIIRFIIPISDYLTDVILYLINKSEYLGVLFPLSESFDSYYLISTVFILVIILLRILRKRKR